MTTNNQLMHKYYEDFDVLNIPRETIRLFLLELCNEKKYNLYINLDNEVDEEIYERFEKGIVRIKKYEPMNYVLGYTWFYGYKILVNEDVLIPRYETEELVSKILVHIDQMYQGYEKIDVVDIGTGSGAIAIALASEESRVRMSASDISAGAIKVAEKNAKLNNLDINFYVGNMVDPIINDNKKVDILICNPPYIPKDEVLEQSVVGFEPHLALFGGEDGLKYYREVFANATKVLNKNGLMAFEIGWNQKETLLAEVKKYLPDSEAEVLKDINKKDRMLFVKVK
jgi:release factor glutamine methyltransferase